MVRFVVMGAGKASRMGRDKLALPWQETTILGYVLDTLLQAIELAQTQMRRAEPSIFSPSAGATDSKGLYLSNAMDDADPTLLTAPFPGFEVVVIARKPAAEFGLKANGLRWIHVPEPIPLAQTIRLGCSHPTPNLHGLCFVPGDQVGLEAEVLADMITHFCSKQPEFLIPVAGGLTGSPVFFHSRYRPDLLQLQGEQGGRKVLERNREHWTLYPVAAEFLRDVDTPEEYAAFGQKNP